MNKEFFLWSIGIIQPINARGIFDFVKIIYPEIDVFSIDDIQQLLKSFEDNKYIICVSQKHKLFSLTHLGNEQLSGRFKRLRDKNRIFLMKEARTDILRKRGAGKGLVGDSPTMDRSSILQGQRPIDSAAVTPGTRSIGRVYWPLLSMQLNLSAGLGSGSPQTHLRYYSFSNLKSIHLAADPYLDIKTTKSDLNVIELSLAIGVSPRLISSLAYNPQKYYRVFEIGKRGGGTRKICSPKIYLKVIQYWILDYLLNSLKIHAECYSYQKGKSIIMNAKNHVSKKYVGNIDIENYFGSINRINIEKILLINNIGPQLAKSISMLTTLNNSLPQGAPTSPTLSNSYLYDFDKQMSEIANRKGVNYTRYADDISLSSDIKKDVMYLINIARDKLQNKDLKLNEAKTRIATRSAQQRVTGIVVNVKVMPPRKLRRNIRAMFHHAKINPGKYREKLDMMNGYLNYFKSFSAIKTKILAEYSEVIKNIRRYCEQGRS